ncbi:glycosyltransferase family 4 protein [Lysinibacillus piscis]|uniref:Glycosyl transferase n=1 Tax=Lysinibacillus piscis TaxID=2518931 RepID=A0ABQ5NN20_9BACI|nr:glycosyltransferase family 4 protein [Lysinibacillus sp. KH24]GLC89776.1 glycosyl transferase [Lysinibacillus sp. KH24]
MDCIGGAQKHVEALTKQLQQDAHDVTIVTGQYDASLWQLQEVKVICIPAIQRAIHAFKDIKACWQLIALLQTIKPDILAIHSSKAGILGRVAGGFLQIPTVFTAHGWSFTEGIPMKRRWMYRWLEKAMQPMTTKIITVSHYDRQLAHSSKIAPPHKIATVHNGIWQEAQTKVQQTCPRITMIARFEAPKRQDLLLEALLELQDLHWHMQFVGDGSAREAAEKFVKHHNLTARVTFLGNQLDVSAILAKSQLFVLLSDWEGLPISIIEAMRAGLPIIATDVGGVGELVVDKSNGFLIAKHDKEQLKTKLQQLLTDKALCQKMSDASERHFLRHFTFQSMYRDTLMVYQQAVMEKGEGFAINSHSNR